MSSKPRAFRSDDPAVSISVLELAEPAKPSPVVIANPSRAKAWPLATILWSSVTGLVGLWLVSSITGFVSDLIARSTVLGTLALVLASLAGLALLALAAREIRAVARAASITRLHAKALTTLMSDDRTEARAILTELDDIYLSRPETAQARTRLTATQSDVIDGRDLLRIAERELMAPLDAQARHAISVAARNVSLATALSPRALVDLLIVGAQSLRLVRNIAEIYGGRPGVAGFLRVLRSVATHLVVTGGIAIGDATVQQILGHGVASRISARLGEGVLNGLLTARVGLAAVDVCRPLPFSAEKRPGLRDVAGALLDRKSVNDEA